MHRCNCRLKNRHLLNTGTKIIAAEILLLPYTDIVYDYINPDIKNGDIAICSRYTPSVEYIGRGENTVGMLNAMDGKVRLWSSDDKGFQEVYEYLIVARSNNA